MLKERSQSLLLTFITTDFLVSLASYALAMFVRFVIQEPDLEAFRDIDFESYVFLGLMMAAIQVVVFFAIGLYDQRRGVTTSEEMTTIVAGVAITILSSLSVLFFLQVDQISRLTIAYFAVLNVIDIALWHAASRRILQKLRERGYNVRHVLIVGTGEAARRLTGLIKNRPIHGYRIIGYVSSEKDEGHTGNSFPVVGELDELEQLLRRYRPDVVVYALPDQGGDRLRRVLGLTDQAGVALKIVPGFSEIITSRGRVESMDGIPILSIRDIPTREGFNRVLKRAFDIAFSGTFLLLFSAFFALIALLVKLTSRGPVFIRQERVGLDNRPFHMLKFRSMYVQDPTAEVKAWTTKDDPRVTPLGRWLRKLSLDETPQFINVLLGKMSVVGPRPERPYFVEQFRDQYKHYMRRHAVKAGITGWAQINGLRGDTSIQERIEADIYYIENWSFWLDIKIILLTPFRGMVNENAY